MSQPLVSIVVLNYKRLAALEQALQSVVAQQYPRKEVIVVDNHSGENVAGVVQKYGTGVRLIELKTNAGACGGRNAGLREARGEILITLDNDVHFLNSDAIDTIVRIFNRQPGYHVLAFQLRDSHTGELRSREWCHPKDFRQFADKSFPTHFFVEGAAAYRREVLDHAGFYFEPLFIYHEGWDLGLRILNCGHRILYAPEIQVGHLMSPEGRANSRPIFLFTRNYIWIAYRIYPLWPGVRFSLFRLMMMAYFALRTGHVSAFIEGLRDGILGCRSLQRAPVSRKTIEYIKSLEKDRPSILARWARHRIAPQL